MRGCDSSHLTRYDIDNSGAIDKQEMLKVMKSLYAMVSGKCVRDIYYLEYNLMRKNCI